MEMKKIVKDYILRIFQGTISGESFPLVTRKTMIEESLEIIEFRVGGYTEEMADECLEAVKNSKLNTWGEQLQTAVMLDKRTGSVIRLLFGYPISA